MPVIDANGCPIHVEVEGPERAPVLILSNSLGTTLHMWDGQVGPFTQHFRLVRFDRRGHGKSGLPKGPYSMELLGRDVLAIMDGLDIKKANWCGLSMGGMEGMWLGANAPERFERLVLSNTSSYFPDKKGWNDRLALVRDKGVPAFAAPNMERWFTKGFRERDPRRDRAHAGHVRGHAARRLSRLRRSGARHGSSRTVAEDKRSDAGRDRPARSRDDAGGRRIHLQKYSRRQRMSMIDAAHISNIEQPQQFNDAVLGFLTQDVVTELPPRTPVSIQQALGREVYVLAHWKCRKGCQT